MVIPALKLYPAYEYGTRSHSTIAEEFASNPRLQKRDRYGFVEMMRKLDFTIPTHITEALRTNMRGGKTVAAEDDLIVLDVRERDAYEGSHVPGARLLPRGQLELRVNQDLPDLTRRVPTCCELGYISTLAASTLREVGFLHPATLDGGMKVWRKRGYPLKVGREP